VVGGAPGGDVGAPAPVSETRTITKVEMMREAVRELGDAPPEALAAFLDRRYGVKLDPRFVPVLKASLRESELLEEFRRRRAATAEAGAAPPPS
jgi:hypothetical protein